VSDPARELDAALTSVAVADLSSWSRLIGDGPDLLDLLHRLTTQDVRGLTRGSGRAAVLTSAKGRIVERLSVHHLGPRGVLLISGPESAGRVLAHLKKYTFAEVTGLSDVSADTVALSVIGPRWREAALAAGVALPEPYGAAAANLAGRTVDVIGTNGFDAEGLIILGPSSGASGIAEALTALGTPIGAAAFEAWRVLTGRPLTGRELTEEYNPLEAGLADAVSFTKGCYVGQEVVARLNTYDKVSRRIVRLALPAGIALPAPGSPVKDGERVLGAVTSAVAIPGREGAAALAYVNLRELPPGRTALAIAAAGGSVSASLVTEPEAS